MANYRTSDHKGASVLVAQLAASGLKHVVISPGSRNAPLTIAFDAHPEVKTHVIIDERSAAYYALGLGLRAGTPAAVLCTSGTAALNHGPAIAEAFHGRTPLISITADRPTTVIDKGHGQSVFQAGVFGKNCSHSVVIEESEMSDEAIIVEAKKAYDIASQGTSVHINVPFEEPLYGLTESDFTLNLIESTSRVEDVPEIPAELLIDEVKVLIVAGSLPFYQNESLGLNLAGVCERFSGIHGSSIVHSADLLLGQNGGALPLELEPDVIVTIGTPTLSKSFRNYLLDKKPNHYHINASGKGWDTWGSLIKVIKTDPVLWLKEYSEVFKGSHEYIEQWKNTRERLEIEISDIPWSDFKAFDTILNSIPSQSTAHLSNSTSARYVQLIDCPKSLKFHCNRGVAGIDGCTSTAVADAEVSGEQVFLISGDIAFMYDINGLALIDRIPSNFNVVVINNGGGEIFRWLDGPESTGLVDKYFETKPRTSIKSAADYCGLKYFCGTNEEETQRAIEQMCNSDTAAILEVVTNGLKSTEVYKTILRK